MHNLYPRGDILLEPKSGTLIWLMVKRGSILFELLGYESAINGSPARPCFSCIWSKTWYLGKWKIFIDISMVSWKDAKNLNAEALFE
jgi:hypothetical protein